MKKEKWKNFVTDRWKVAAPGLLAAFAVCFIFFYLCTVGIVCYEPDRILV